MADKPILFSGPMVRAILDGRKTQTRRVLKPQPVGTNLVGIYAPHLTAVFNTFPDMPHGDESVRLPYAPGDRLWVRESIGRRPASFLGIEATNGVEGAFYCADDEDVVDHHEFNLCPWWRQTKTLPSIHMPRWASRLTLTVTEVRVQRVQEMPYEDTFAEGVVDRGRQDGEPYPHCHIPGVPGMEHHAIEMYANYWDSLNAKRGYGWDANPWVAAITFDTHRRNIDAMPEAA